MAQQLALLTIDSVLVDMADEHDSAETREAFERVSY